MGGFVFQPLSVDLFLEPASEMMTLGFLERGVLMS